MATRFKPIAVNLEEHAKIAKIAERLSQKTGFPVTVPQVVIRLVNEYGDKL